MEIVKRIMSLALLLALAVGASAQTVSGTVTDASTGETLIGATVLDPSSGKGTVTNAYGLSIYFPYQKTGKVKTAAQQYGAIGMADE